MDAPPLSPELRHELDGLRRRAYGERADIQQDPDAVRRLGELEARARDAGSPAGEPATAARRDSAPGAPADESPRGDPQSVDEPDAAAPRAGRRWWRHPALWIAAAGALVVGLLAGYLLADTVGPRPDAVLAPIVSEGAAGYTLDPDSYLDYLGLAAGDLTPYEPFYDVIIWAGDTASGSRCLLVVGDMIGILWAACAPAGLEPVVDLPVRSRRFLEDLELGSGGSVRFVEREGRVEVFVGSGANAS